MSKNKDQHYVSAFYLYNFTNDVQKHKSGSNKRKTSIWHYDYRKEEIKERPIYNVATESYLFSFLKDDGDYDHSLDNELKESEQRAAQAFTELNDIVSEFKKGKTREVRINDEILDNVIEFMVWQIRRHPELVSSINQECVNYCDGKNREMSPKEMTLDVVRGFGRDEYSDFASILMGKNKRILFTTNPKSSFITSDMPFIRFNKEQPDGLKYDDTEVYFPLASNLLLCLYGTGGHKVFQLENDRKYLKSLNVYMAKKSKNYIFGVSKEHVESIVKAI